MAFLVLLWSDEALNLFSRKNQETCENGLQAISWCARPTQSNNRWSCGSRRDSTEWYWNDFVHRAKWTGLGQNHDALVYLSLWENFSVTQPNAVINPLQLSQGSQISFSRSSSAWLLTFRRAIWGSVSPEQCSLNRLSSLNGQAAISHTHRKKQNKICLYLNISRKGYVSAQLSNLVPFLLLSRCGDLSKLYCPSYAREIVSARRLYLVSFETVFQSPNRRRNPYESAYWGPKEERWAFSNHVHWKLVGTSPTSPRGWQGSWRTQIWPAPQPSYFLLQISTINAFTCTLITCHLSFTILNSLKPLRHTCDFFVDELLSYMSPTLVYQLFYSSIIPMWVFTNSLFHRLPTVLYRGQIWTFITVEIRSQDILLLPFAYNVWLPLSVPWISIFLQYRILVNLKLWLDNWLKSFIYIYLLAYFTICIPRYLIEVNVGLEIMPNCCPTMIEFCVFFSRLMYFFNSVSTITYACLSDNPKLVLGAIAEMYFAIETYSLLIFRVRILFKHHCSQFKRSFAVFSLTHPPLQVMHLW